MPYVPKKIHTVKSTGKVYKPKNENWLKNKEDAAFYNTSSWRKLSITYKKRHPTCEGEDCTQPSYYTDHIIPISDGGDKLAWSNLQALCRSCNAIKTAKQKNKVY